MNDASILDDLEPAPIAIGWMISLRAAAGEHEQAVALAEALIDVRREGQESKERPEA